MLCYEKMYYTLFNAITDALRLMEREDYAKVVALLTEAQCKTEEMYIEECE